MREEKDDFGYAGMYLSVAIRYYVPESEALWGGRRIILRRDCVFGCKGHMILIRRGVESAQRIHCLLWIMVY